MAASFFTGLAASVLSDAKATKISVHGANIVNDTVILDVQVSVPLNGLTVLEFPLEKVLEFFKLGNSLSAPSVS